MSQSIIVTGANFASSGLGRSLQLTTDRTNLVGEFIFGRDATTSTYNSAYAGAAPASVVGTLTYSDHFINPAGANFIKTDILNNTNMTMMAVVAPGAAITEEIYFSSTSGAGNNGFYVGVYLGPPLVSVTNNTGTVSQAIAGSTLASPGTDYRAVAGRIGGTSSFSLEVDEFKGGARVQAATVTGTGTRVVDSQTICIGSLNGSTTIWTNPKTMSAALIWHRLLTDAELLNAYLECRNTLSKMNITC